MTGFNHTLAGCIIAVITPAPLVPFVAFASHFLLDATPHFGRNPQYKPYTKKFKRLLVVDAFACTASLLLAIYLFPDKWFILGVGALFSTLPDFMWLLRGRVDWLRPFFRFAGWVQWGERPYGWIFELLYCGAFVLILLALAS